ncbi:MAG TPA: hypothetical protein VGR38_03735 [Candidatus Polarisedimenticolia bacterium]|nr:hypothetical protein [Candidatus Polarisedimenticolia bacterium]
MGFIKGIKAPGRTGLIALVLLSLALPRCSRQESSSPGRRRASSGDGEVKQPKTRTAPPQVSRLTIPQGTEIHLLMNDSLSSSTSQTGDTFSVKTSDPVVIGERVAIPAGSVVHGQVTDVVPARKGLQDKGGALTLSFDKVVTPSGFSAPMAARLTGASRSGKRTAGIVGGGAAGGALLGKILGGSTKDAAVGAVVGGAIGTGIAAGTKGKEVEIPAGSHLSIRLDQPLTIAVRP